MHWMAGRMRGIEVVRVGAEDGTGLGRIGDICALGRRFRVDKGRVEGRFWFRTEARARFKAS